MKDVIIIGAGPVGLYATYYASSKGLDTLLVDSLSTVGGQPSALYPEKTVLNFPGCATTTGQGLVDALYEQVKTTPAEISLETTVTNLDVTNEVFTLETNNGTFQARSVILAIGSGAFAPRPLNIPGEENHKNIYYAVKDLSQFANRNVLIFGGGDSAIDWALEIEKIASSVTVIHRRDEFRAHETSLDKLRASSATISTPYSPIEVSENEITIKNNTTEEIQTISFDDIIVNFGFVSNLGFVENINNIELDKKQIQVSLTGQTNITGLYAIGDIAGYQGKIKNIASGIGEAPKVVTDIFRELFPDKKPPSGW